MSSIEKAVVFLLPLCGYLREVLKINTRAILKR
jgi:hypothetical protein